LISLDAKELEALADVLEGDELRAKWVDARPDAKTWKQLAEDVKDSSVDVVLNFECCSGCAVKGGYKSFGSAKSAALRLVKLVCRDKGWLVMFSDYSLRAAITDWDAELLGPLPIEALGSCSEKFTLRFDPKTLTECTSTQLNTVGELCTDGSAVVRAMVGTVVYTVVDTSSAPYSTQVLTIQTDHSKEFRGVPAGKECVIGASKGSAGHVLITYPSGGQMLFSSGHWISLAQIDVSVESVVTAARSRYGKVYSEEVAKELRGYSSARERRSATSKYASHYIKSATPSRKGGYMNISSMERESLPRSSPSPLVEPEPVRGTAYSSGTVLVGTPPSSEEEPFPEATASSSSRRLTYVKEIALS
jgi:hypothetical protein